MAQNVSQSWTGAVVIGTLKLDQESSILPPSTRRSEGTDFGDYPSD